MPKRRWGEQWLPECQVGTLGIRLGFDLPNSIEEGCCLVQGQHQVFPIAYKHCFSMLVPISLLVVR